MDQFAALQMYEQGCDAEHWSSCSAAGILYEGHGAIPRDLNRTRQLFERGCANQKWICLNLGALYADGLGVPRDLVKARHLIEESCEKWAGGCVELANFLRHYLHEEAEADRTLARACRMDAVYCEGNATSSEPED